MALGEPLFSELLQRLDGEKGMRRKIRLLAHSWSLVRELSPEQQQTVALAIGNKWAWRNIEKFFGNRKELTAGQLQVKELFDSLRETDPRELRQMASEVRQGDYSTVKERAVEALGDALDDEVEEEVTVEGEAGEVAEQDRGAEVEYRPPPKEPLVEAAPAREPARPRAPIESAPEPKRKQESEPAVELEDSDLEPAEVIEAFFELDTQEMAAPSGIESLRVLRRLARGQAATTRSDRTAMVRGLTSGWAARRAVSSLIRSHAADDLDEALALISQLPTATQQTWCLGDLVEHWDLDEVSLRRVLAAAPTESAKRRLERRAARAV